MKAGFRFATMFVIAAMMVGTAFAQVEKVGVDAQVATQVGKTARSGEVHRSLLAKLFGMKSISATPGLRASIAHVDKVEIVARHADGTEFYRYVTHNLTTDAGFDAAAKALGDTAAQPAAGNYIALTNTAITPGAGDTTLSGEIAANGLTRAQATFAHSNGTKTYTLTKVFTASGTQASQASAVFNASSVGTMFFEATYTAVTVNNTDTLTVTWTVTLS